VPAAAGYTEEQWSQFTSQVEGYIKGATQGDRLAISFGWIDAQHNYTYTAGMVNQTDGTRRPVNSQDTYLYGSASKTLTTTAIMSLVEKGALNLDDPVTKHVDRLLGLYQNTSLVDLWGPRAAQVTVRMCLHMSSGIIDYDNYEFDDWMLINDSMGVVSPVEFIAYPARLPESKRFLCDPGTCRSYSSTNFVLLGLVLTEHSGQDDWTKVKTSHFWGPDVQARFGDLHFFTDEPLFKWLTTPGLTYTYTAPRYIPEPHVVALQNSSITGFTCANAVTSPLTMARFFHALVHEASVVGPASYKEMTAFEPLNAGWAKGWLAYGLGLMRGSSNNKQGTTNFTTWGDYIGHMGDVYGFSSQQAYYYGVNATIAVALNTDGGGHDQPSSFSVSCQVIQAASNILYNASVDMGC